MCNGKSGVDSIDVRTIGCLWVATTNLQAPSFATPPSKHIFQDMTWQEEHHQQHTIPLCEQIFFNFGVFRVCFECFT